MAPIKNRQNFKLKEPDIKEYKAKESTEIEIQKYKGRPRLVIDEAQVELLASYDCTMKEIACFVGCHVDTLYNHFIEAVKRGREKGNCSIKRKMFELAVSGNVTLLIWLSKQRLGYSENPMTDSIGMQFNIQINEIPK
jgi:hypothetical protein